MGIDNVMPMVMWVRYFLQAQGYEVRDSEIYQDNQSAMLLEKNGKPNDDPLIWSKTDPPYAKLLLQRVKKVAVHGRDVYMPVTDDDPNTYLVKFVSDVQRVLGSLHNESEITD